ncbi:MAG: hypothetical protein JWM34_1887 [Ilumatobacteraceae bacterium]|nr:hypothetical protein [Ilumatobacteraceae bacterium]
MSSRKQTWSGILLASALWAGAGTVVFASAPAIVASPQGRPAAPSSALPETRQPSAQPSAQPSTSTSAPGSSTPTGDTAKGDPAGGPMVAMPTDAYQALSPVRVLDTREGLGISASLGDAVTADLQVTGKAGVPASAVGAVVLNLTVTDATKSSYVTAWPSGQDRPTASNLNVDAGGTAPNLVIVPVGADGRISLYNNAGTVDLIADVQGWFPAASSYRPLTSSRILDSRTGLGTPQTLGAATSIDLQIAGHGGVPATGASAVVMNVTATNPTESSFVTVWPTGADRPLASNLNVVAAQTVPNLVVVPVGADGRVSMFNNAGSIDLIADVEGYFAAGDDYTPLTPSRVLDTRSGQGIPVALGQAASADLQVTGQGGVPATGVGAVAMNLTATGPTASSYITAWPTGFSRPLASNLNVVAGQTSPNLVIVPVGTDGKVSLYNNGGSTDLVADVEGWFPLASGISAQSWEVRPASVLLSPGERTVVDLIALGSDDKPDPSAEAATTVTFEATGDGVTAEYIGADRVELTAGADPTSATIAIRPDQAAVPAAVTATVVHLQPGVTQISDESVVFPAPYESTEAGQRAALGDMLSGDQLAGFTIAEIAARTHASAADDPSQTAGAYFPLILKGDPPATGSVIITAGGSGVTGTVIERDGAPTLQRNGFSLVTVALVPFDALYADLNYGVTSAQIGDIGLPTEPPDPAAAKPTGATEAVGSPISCSAAVSSAELKIILPMVHLDPTFEATFTQHDDAPNDYKILFSLAATVSAGLSLELQNKLSADCTIELSPEVDQYVPLPVGPLSTVLSADLSNQLIAKIGFAWKEGPKYTFSVTCQLGGTVNVGFQSVGGTFDNLTGFTPALGCPTAGGTLPTSSAQAEQLELNGGLFDKVDIGAAIGGSISKAIGWLINDPALGKFSLLTGNVGPNINYVTENADSVLSAEAASTNLSLDFKGTVSLNLKNVQWLTQAFGPIGSASAVVFDATKTIIPAYKAPAPSTLEYAIGSDPYQPLPPSGPIAVEPHDVLHVRSTFPAGSAPGLTLDGVYTPPSSPDGGFVKSPLFTAGSGSGDSIVAEHTYTSDDCTATGDGAGNFNTLEYKIAAASKPTLFGWTIDGNVPLWGGKFSVQCVLGKMSFDADQVTDLTGPTRVNLLSYGKTVTDWQVSSKPSFVDRVVPFEGTWPVNHDKDNPTSQALSIVPVTQPGGVCQEAKTENLVITSATNKRGTATLPISLFDNCYLKFDVPMLSGSGQAHLLTRGFGIEQFTVDAATVPSWLHILPMTGDLPPAPVTEQSVLMSFTVDRRNPTCQNQPAVTATVFVHSESRGTARINVQQPAVGRLTCDPPTGKGGGDPHMTSFDGVRYDAQVRGEYIWAETLPSADVPVQVTTRQESTQISNVTAPVTSVTAVAVQVGAHQVETYLRNTDGLLLPAPAVYVDHQPVTLAPSSSLQVSDDLSISLSQAVYTITGPGIVVTAAVNGSTIFDVAVTVDPDAPYVGLLGSPDGDPSNDITTAAGHTYAYGEIAGHQQALYDFAQSWRVTDPAASPFTVPYIGFDDAQLPADDSILQPFRQQAADLLAGLDSVCDVQTSVDSHLVDGLALELAIGRTPSQLTSYSCSYVVQGTALSGGSGIPGAQVGVSVDGLRPCTAVTDANGLYQCLMTPDLAAITAHPPALPLHVVASVRFPGQSTAVATTTTSFPNLALVGGRPTSVSADFDIDPSLLPNVDISGTMKTAGQPIAGPVQLTIIGYSAAGNQLTSVQQSITPDPDDGSYALTRVLPFGATKVSVSAPIGVVFADQPTVVQTGLVNGPNAVPFSFDYDPAVVTVAGTMKGADGHPLTGSQTVAITAYAAGSVVRTVSAAVIPSSVDGSYAIDFTAPLGTDRVVAQAQIGIATADYPSAELDSLVPGTQALALDVDYEPPVLTVSGIAQRDSAPITTPISVTITSFDSQGHQLIATTTATTPASGGHYSLDFTLPLAATSAQVVAQLGVVAADRPLTTVTGLHVGSNAVTFSFDFHPPSIVLSGTMKNTDGTAITGPVVVTFATFQGSIQGTTVSALVSIAGDGSYSTTRDVPVGTTKVIATADVGVVSADWPQQTLQPVVAGPDPFTFDVVYGPPTVVVSGTLVDALGHPLPPLNISIKEFDGAQQIASDAASITPAAGTGAFSATFTLPLSTTSVTASAPIGRFVGVDDATAQLSTVVPGVNHLDLSAVYDPPLVALGGTLLDDLGQPITAVTSFRITSKQNGTVLSSEVLATTPNPSGLYSLQTTAARFATDVDITAEVGGAQSDWVVVNRTVVPGANTLTFDVALALPRLQISGTLTRDGAPITGTVELLVVSTTDGGQQVGADLIHPTLDSNGHYAIEYVAPTGTTSVLVRADLLPSTLGQDDPQTTVTGIHVGNNAIAFSANIVSTSLHLTGTILRDGAPVVGNVSVWEDISVGGQFQSTIFTRVVTDSSGRYTFDSQVRGATDAVRLRFRVPPGIDGEQLTYDVVDDITSVVDGTTNNATYDIDAHPRSLALTGTVLTDGVAPAGQTLTTTQFLDANGQQISSSDRLLTFPAGGAYGIGLLVPDNAATAHLIIKLGPTYDWFTKDIPLATTQHVTDTFDVAYHPVTVTVHGAIRDVGNPATAVSVHLEESANNVDLGQPMDVTATNVDGLGNYSVTFHQVPRLADNVQITVTYTIAGSSTPDSVGFGTTTTPGHDVDEPFTIDSQQLEVTGVLVDDADQPMPFTRPAPVHIVWRDENGQSMGGTGYQMSWNGDGTFATVTKPPVAAASVDFSVGVGAVVNIPLAGLTTQTDIGHYTYVPLADLTVNGVVTSGGSPFAQGDTRVVITPYHFDDETFGLPDHLTPLAAAQEVSTTTDDDGNYTAPVQVPVGTNLVDVRVFLDGATDDDYFDTGIFIDPDQSSTTQTFDVVEVPDTHRTVEFDTRYGTDASQSCADAPDTPFLVHYRFTTDNGANVVAEGIGIPDPSTGKVHVRLDASSGFDLVPFHEDSDMYDDAINAAPTGGSDSAVAYGDTTGDTGTGFTVERNCTP